MAKLRMLSRATFTIALLFAAGTVFAETVKPSDAAPSRPGAHARASSADTPAATASRQPSVAIGATPTDAPAAADSQAAKLVATLRAAGISATTADVRALAAKVGIGEVVRVLALSKATGKSTAQLLAMRATGKGWGEIARDLARSPEIGSIMSGGQDKGQGKTRPARTPKPDH
jgi:hypothetical protein